MGRGEWEGGGDVGSGEKRSGELTKRILYDKLTFFSSLRSSAGIVCSGRGARAPMGSVPPYMSP